jgi:hypothetical protein
MVSGKNPWLMMGRIEKMVGVISDRLRGQLTRKRINVFNFWVLKDFYEELYA